MSLDIQLLSTDPLASEVDALVVSVFQGAVLEHALVASVNKTWQGALAEHLKHADFEGKKDQVADIPTLGRLKARRLILLGIGNKADFDIARARTAAAASVRAALGNVRSIALALPDANLRALAEGTRLGAYRFLKYFTGDRKPKAELGKVLVFYGGKAGAAEKKQFAQGLAIAEAVCITRDAVNEPPNVVHPEALAQLARAIAREHGLKIKVLDKAGILAAGMNLHYAVGQGSTNEPRFIHLTYVPRKKKKKLVFIGKGLTFDSGGLCIKPAPGMEEMKSDMAGAASILGLMAAIATVRPDIEVHGIVGAAENMPDGSAYRPADVFTSLEGKTVEIINTDAEGRLVLADALAYATRLKPDAIIDAATLTGAALVALGKTYSAFYATNDELAKNLEAAAKQGGENFWRMPLIDELAEGLKSDVADLKHVADRYGGSITAALFLKEFVGKTPWIHCDIAGPVLADRARGTYPKGATGHSVLTFLNLVERLAGE